ncbi:hypothetical protein [Nocardia sp. BSTN01]|nr:hypothetical protein [Nocardia sp. BSTN01]
MTDLSWSPRVAGTDEESSRAGRCVSVDALTATGAVSMLVIVAV